MTWPDTCDYKLLAFQGQINLIIIIFYSLFASTTFGIRIWKRISLMSHDFITLFSLFECKKLQSSNNTWTSYMVRLNKAHLEMLGIHAWVWSLPKPRSFFRLGRNLSIKTLNLFYIFFHDATKWFKWCSTIEIKERNTQLCNESTGKKIKLHYEVFKHTFQWFGNCWISWMKFCKKILPVEKERTRMLVRLMNLAKGDVNLHFNLCPCAIWRKNSCCSNVSN